VQAVRSKEHYHLEIRPGISPNLIKTIVEASFLPSVDNIGAATNSLEWSIDMRVPLSAGFFLGPLVAEMRDILSDQLFSQVAGLGFGSFLIVGGILAASEGFSGGLIRESRKEYGFRKLIEGQLDAKRPIVIVDDVLSSGRSAARAAAVLRKEGFDPVGVLTVLRYGWKEGDQRLRDAGLTSDSLATLYSQCD
jgi:orotate phosphoribosyltransferase